MQSELFAQLQIEHQLALAMMVPRDAICAFLNLGVCQVNAELANLNHADKEVLQLAYVKLIARRAELQELQDFFATLPTTLPGETQ